MNATYKINRFVTTLVQLRVGGFAVNCWQRCLFTVTAQIHRIFYSTYLQSFFSFSHSVNQPCSANCFGLFQACEGEEGWLTGTSCVTSYQIYKTMKQISSSFWAHRPGHHFGRSQRSTSCTIFRHFHLMNWRKMKESRECESVWRWPAAMLRALWS